MRIQILMVAAVAVTLLGTTTQTVSAQSLSNNLFSQYETPQGASTTTAGLYQAPHYVPHNVGSTYYTYQPLQPHEFMYTHSRNYYNPYAGADNFYANQCNGRGCGSGFNVTKVKWYNGCTHLGPLPLSIAPFARLSDHLARSKYCRKSGNCGGGKGGHFGKGRHGHHRRGCSDGSCGGGCSTGNCGSTTGDVQPVPVTNGADGATTFYSPYGVPSANSTNGASVTLTDQTINR